VIITACKEPWLYACHDILSLVVAQSRQTVKIGPAGLTSKPVLRLTGSNCPNEDKGLGILFHICRYFHLQFGLMLASTNN
jgi:hypothetical protein